MIYHGDDDTSGCPLRDTVYQRISAIMHVQYTINVHHRHFGTLCHVFEGACLFFAMASSLEELARRAEKATARTQETFESVDIADQLEEHAWLGILFDAFTIERFHVRVKRTAVDLKRNNQQSADFERYDCSKADCSKASTLQRV